MIYAPQTLNGDLFTEASHDDLTAVRVALQNHGYQIPIEDAGISHAVACHPQEHIRHTTKQRRANVKPIFYVLHRSERDTSRNPTKDGQRAVPRGHRAAQLQAASSRRSIDDAAPLQRDQVLLCGGSVDPKLLGNVRPSRWTAAMSNLALHVRCDLPLSTRKRAFVGC